MDFNPYHSAALGLVRHPYLCGRPGYGLIGVGNPDPVRRLFRRKTVVFRCAGERNLVPVHADRNLHAVQEHIRRQPCSASKRKLISPVIVRKGTPEAGAGRTIHPLCPVLHTGYETACRIGKNIVKFPVFPFPVKSQGKVSVHHPQGSFGTVFTLYCLICIIHNNTSLPAWRVFPCHRRRRCHCR